MSRISEIKERLTAIKIAAENNLLAERLRLIGVVVREDAPYLLDENARLNEQVEALDRCRQEHEERLRGPQGVPGSNGYIPREEEKITGTIGGFTLREAQEASKGE